MRTRTLVIAAAMGAALIAPAPARANHSMIVQSATDKPVTLRGTVTQLVWTNPHSWIFIDVKDAEGGVANWRVSRDVGPCHGVRGPVRRVVPANESDFDLRLRSQGSRWNSWSSPDAIASRFYANDDLAVTLGFRHWLGL
jgi:hypothetical protein